MLDSTGAAYLIRTGHLIITRRSLINKGAVNKQDFDHIADEMGLKPFAAKSEDEKRALGELQLRVESLIDIAQHNKKAPLTREEKQVLMQQEMARKVSVENSWWFGSSQKPIIQMTNDDAKRVIVPTSERTKIVDALKAMYQKNPSNTAYAPTEDNVRRLYLRAQGPATSLIPNG